MGAARLVHPFGQPHVLTPVLQLRADRCLIWCLLERTLVRRNRVRGSPAAVLQFTEEQRRRRESWIQCERADQRRLRLLVLSEQELGHPLAGPQFGVAGSYADGFGEGRERLAEALLLECLGGVAPCVLLAFAVKIWASSEF